MFNMKIHTAVSICYYNRLNRNEARSDDVGTIEWRISPVESVITHANIKNVTDRGRYHFRTYTRLWPTRTGFLSYCCSSRGSHSFGFSGCVAYITLLLLLLFAKLRRQRRWQWQYLMMNGDSVVSPWAWNTLRYLYLVHKPTYNILPTYT